MPAIHPTIQPAISELIAPEVQGSALTVDAQFAAFMAALSGPKLLLDLSRAASRFQEVAGSTLVTADGQPLGRLNDVSGAGNHVGQSTPASMPLYRTDGVLHWAEADGTNDGWQSLANFDASGVNKLTMIVGLRKRSDAAAGVLVELGSSFSTPGGFGVFAPPVSGSASYQVALTGASNSAAATAAGTAPDRAVLTIQMDLSAATAAAALSIQRTSDAPVTGFSVPGSRNFISAALNLMRRNNANTPAAVDLFGLMIVPGILSASDLSLCKRWMASKTGVTL